MLPDAEKVALFAAGDVGLTQCVDPVGAVRITSRIATVAGRAAKGFLPRSENAHRRNDSAPLAIGASRGGMQVRGGFLG